MDLLKNINSPDDLRLLSRTQLHALADELRKFVLDSVSQTGGHLSSNLGTVELTIALHYVFNTPEDRIVWDVGHQTYAHKILTGRRERCPACASSTASPAFRAAVESEYDTFGTAHSSTSISAALGMAVAAEIKGENRARDGRDRRRRDDRRHGLRGDEQAGVMEDVNLLVVLNDNDMSISPAGRRA